MLNDVAARIIRYATYSMFFLLILIWITTVPLFYRSVVFQYAGENIWISVSDGLFVVHGRLVPSRQGASISWREVRSRNLLDCLGLSLPSMRFEPDLTVVRGAKVDSGRRAWPRIVIPIWVPAISILSVLWLVRFKRHLPKDKYCSSCGYCLRANSSGVCPECGLHFRQNHSKKHDAASIP